MNDENSQHIHEISGDGQMTITERFMYLFRNAARNIHFRPGSIQVKAYHPDTITDAMALASPSRALTLAFLEQKLPELLPVGKVHILDIGCGSGFMSDTFADRGYTGNYTGIDIGDRFHETFQHPDAFDRTFINADAHTFTSDTPYDLIFSFSALEHIPKDNLLIEHLNSVLSDKGIHLHIIPSAWGLPLYLWHGFRQYTRCDIEDRFGSENLKIFALGGLFSFILHFTFITGMEMILRLPARKWFSKLYMFLHRICLRLDHVLPFGPAAYVVCKTKS